MEPPPKLKILYVLWLLYGVLLSFTSLVILGISLFNIARGRQSPLLSQGNIYILSFMIFLLFLFGLFMCWVCFMFLRKKKIMIKPLLFFSLFVFFSFPFGTLLAIATLIILYSSEARKFLKKQT